jgi:hypothetical protein
MSSPVTGIEYRLMRFAAERGKGAPGAAGRPAKENGKRTSLRRPLCGIYRRFGFRLDAGGSAPQL